MLGGSCDSAIGAIEGAFRPAMLIIAADNTKIARLIAIFNLILVVGLISNFNLILLVALIAFATLVFTPRKIAGIGFCPLPQDTISVLRAAPNLALVPYTSPHK